MRPCDGASDRGFFVDVETGRMQLSGREILFGNAFWNDFPGRARGCGLCFERKSCHRIYGIACILSVFIRRRRKISGKLVFIFSVSRELYRKTVSGCNGAHIAPDSSVDTDAQRMILKKKHLPFPEIGVR